MFELSNGFCMRGVSKGKINLVELSNVRVNGQSSYRMLTVYVVCVDFSKMRALHLHDNIFIRYIIFEVSILIYQ